HASWYKRDNVVQPAGGTYGTATPTPAWTAPARGADPGGGAARRRPGRRQLRRLAGEAVARLGGESASHGRADHEDRDQSVLREDEAGRAEGGRAVRGEAAHGGRQVRRRQRQSGHGDREHGHRRHDG